MKSFPSRFGPRSHITHLLSSTGPFLPACEPVCITTASPYPQPPPSSAPGTAGPIPHLCSRSFLSFLNHCNGHFVLPVPCLQGTCPGCRDRWSGWKAASHLCFLSLQQPWGLPPVSPGSRSPAGLPEAALAPLLAFLLPWPNLLRSFDWIFLLSSKCQSAPGVCVSDYNNPICSLRQGFHSGHGTIVHSDLTAELQTCVQGPTYLLWGLGGLLKLRTGQLEL